MACLMNPLPGEDDPELEETISYIRKLNPPLISIYSPEIFFGTPWFSHEKNIVIKNPESIMKRLVKLGGLMTWTHGNKILPVVLRDECIGQEIIFNGKPFKDVFYTNRKFMHRVHKTMEVSQNVGQICDIRMQKRHSDLKYRKLLDKAMEYIYIALLTGEFKFVYPIVQEFNEISTCGKLL